MIVLWLLILFVAMAIENNIIMVVMARYISNCIAWLLSHLFFVVLIVYYSVVVVGSKFLLLGRGRGLFLLLVMCW